MKIYRRLRTLILALLLVVIVVLTAILSHSNYHEDDNWKTSAAQTIEHHKTELANTEMPENFKKQMREEMRLQQYMLDHNYPPIDKTLWGGMLTCGWLDHYGDALYRHYCGDMVAGEFTWGTIKLLLIRPASRSKILLSKYLTTLLFAATLLAFIPYILDRQWILVWVRTAESAPSNRECSRTGSGN